MLVTFGACRPAVLLLQFKQVRRCFFWHCRAEYTHTTLCSLLLCRQAVRMLQIEQATGWAGLDKAEKEIASFQEALDGWMPEVR